MITGASGFLGRHLVRRLAELGWSLDAIDVRPLPENPAIEQAIRGDVREILPRLENRYDLAVHLAASVGGRTGIERDPLGVASNLALDAEFFSFASRTRPGRCIYLSSSAVYPVSRQTDSWNGRPLREDEVDVAKGPIGIPDLTYGWAKLTGEYLALVTQQSFGVPTAIYRPFSIYGPGQSSDYPVTAICERALSRQDPLVVWGTGTQQRDFVYIEDFLGVVVATFDEVEAVSPINIASGTGTDFLTVAKMAASLVPYQPTVQARENRPQGVQRRVGSSERMGERFTLRVSLAEGLTSIMRSLVREDPAVLSAEP